MLVSGTSAIVVVSVMPGIVVLSGTSPIVVVVSISFGVVGTALDVSTPTRQISFNLIIQKL